MDIDPSANDLNFAREREMIVEAAAKIAAVLAQVQPEERSELLKAAADPLDNAGVLIVDTSDSGEDERRGKHHDFTRSQILEIIAAREKRWRRVISSSPS